MVGERRSFMVEKHFAYVAWGMRIKYIKLLIWNFAAWDSGSFSIFYRAYKQDRLIYSRLMNGVFLVPMKIGKLTRQEIADQSLLPKGIFYQNQWPCGCYLKIVQVTNNTTCTSLFTWLKGHNFFTFFHSKSSNPRILKCYFLPSISEKLTPTETYLYKLPYQLIKISLYRGKAFPLSFIPLQVYQYNLQLTWDYKTGPSRRHQQLQP